MLQNVANIASLKKNWVEYVVINNPGLQERQKSVTRCLFDTQIVHFRPRQPKACDSRTFLVAISANLYYLGCYFLFLHILM